MTPLVVKGLPLRPRELLIKDVDTRIAEESIRDTGMSASAPNRSTSAVCRQRTRGFDRGYATGAEQAAQLTGQLGTSFSNRERVTNIVGREYALYDAAAGRPVPR